MRISYTAFETNETSADQIHWDCQIKTEYQSFNSLYNFVDFLISDSFGRCADFLSFSSNYAYLFRIGLLFFCAFVCLMLKWARVNASDVDVVGKKDVINSPKIKYSNYSNWKKGNELIYKNSFELLYGWIKPRKKFSNSNCHQ